MYNTLLILICILLIPVCSLIIAPNGRISLYDLCNGDDHMWEAKIYGGNNTFVLVLEPCSASSPRSIVSIGTLFVGYIRCNAPVETCLYIENHEDKYVDVRFDIWDRTPPYNWYFPLFWTFFCLVIVIPIIASLSFFGLGIYVGKKAKAKIEVRNTVVPAGNELVQVLLENSSAQVENL